MIFYYKVINDEGTAKVGLLLYLCGGKNRSDNLGHSSNKGGFR